MRGPAPPPRPARAAAAAALPLLLLAALAAAAPAAAQLASWEVITDLQAAKAAGGVEISIVGPPQQPFSRAPPRTLDPHLLADFAAQLNLLQVSDLTEVLKKKLGIQGGAMMGMPMGMPMMGAAAAPAAAPAAEAPKEEKTEFTLKLEGFDAAAKIKVIKEVRAITGLGLKEAKELVSFEGCVRA